MDGSQHLNDDHGHDVGDQVIQRVSELLNREVGDRVIRWGGDEWLIPYEGPDGPERFATCLERVAQDALLETLCGGVTLSGGAVPHAALPNAATLRPLEEALVLAKENGRARLEILHA
ncbi:MAG: diguanylate cyclase [Planctomycetes bacterium]|nr:diguanylate cyclase [Planctomycetota bacterium]